MVFLTCLFLVFPRGKVDLKCVYVSIAYRLVSKSEAIYTVETR